MIEFRYTLEIGHDKTPQQKPLLHFASKIQQEVSLLGGTVVAAWIEDGKAKVTISFFERDEIEGYIRWYFEDDFPEDEIEAEVASIIAEDVSSRQL